MSRHPRNPSRPTRPHPRRAPNAQPCPDAIRPSRHPYRIAQHPLTTPRRRYPSFKGPEFSGSDKFCRPPPFFCGSTPRTTPRRGQRTRSSIDSVFESRVPTYLHIPDTLNSFRRTAPVFPPDATRRDGTGGCITPLLRGVSINQLLKPFVDVSGSLQ